MRVIKTQNYDIYGNDCMIYKTIHLIHNSEGYSLQIDTKVTGWCASKDSNNYKLKTTQYQGLNKEISKIMKNDFDFGDDDTFTIDSDDLR